MRIRMPEPSFGARNFRYGLFLRDFAAPVLIHDAAQISRDSFRRPFPHKDISRKMPISEKIHAMRNGKQFALAQFEPKRLHKETRKPFADAAQSSFISKETKIVTITDVILDVPRMLHGHVELIEIQIPEPLRHVISNRHIRFRVRAVDDFVHDGKNSFVFDFLSDDSFERLVMD